MDESSGRPMAARGAAWRRRHLGSMLRHERQTVAMALAECQHHSAQRQKTADGCRVTNWRAVLATTVFVCGVLSLPW